MMKVGSRNGAIACRCVSPNLLWQNSCFQDQRFEHSRRKAGGPARGERGMVARPRIATHVLAPKAYIRVGEDSAKTASPGSRYVSPLMMALSSYATSA